MKSAFIATAIIAVSTSSVFAYQCPDPTSVDNSCRQLNVFPLVCSNPLVNKNECNAKQCNQPYIDNYAACQCRGNPNSFFEHSVNVQGLLKRCGTAGAGLTNPYGNPLSYRPGQGTATFSVTSTIGPSSTSAAPIVDPTGTPVPVNSDSNGLSGGAIAGIVIGCLAAVALAGVLAWCWRKKRHQHTGIYSQHTEQDYRGPTRTVVTEKIEPVVVKTGATQYNTSATAPAGTNTYTTATPSTTAYNTTTPSTTAYNTTTPGATAYNNTTTPGTTSYNTTTPSTTAYNTTTPGTTTYNTSSSNNPFSSSANNYGTNNTHQSTAHNTGYDTSANNAYNTGRNVVDGTRNTTTTNTNSNAYNAG
ncbi:hypothetical protein BG004_002368 [Podila humilis]|nr:hypothetical protein BG004_002368 [Podila humilis]